jgi:preprotein translocase subunit SecE
MAQRARARQQQIRPAAQPVKSQGGRRALPGGGGRRFIAESWGELKKVEWPGQNQVIQGTVVVLIACIIVGIYLYASDQVFKRLVENVLLK